MSAQPNDNQTQVQEKTNTKEDNLVLMRQKYERELAQERGRREEIERQLQEKERSKQQALQDDDDDDSEPYVDRKRLKKESAKLTQQIKQETQTDIQRAVQQALQEERKQNWLKQNNDFYDVLQHADKFAERDPELAETILAMPEGFERQKLVYKNIKALGLHKPPEKQSTVQDKIDANRRSPYYKQPEMGTAPYSQVGDYSAQGQEQAYKKMQELKGRLRL
jgi:hypothetical protein